MNRIDYNDEYYYLGGIQEAPIGNPSIFPLSQEDIDKIVEDNGGSGTGGNIDPEQKEITCIENGVKIIEPSGDFEGLSSVKVTVDVPQKAVKDETVSVSTTENGTVDVLAADYGVDGLKEVSVTVNVPSPSIKPEPVSLTFNENRTYTISAEEYNVNGLSSVDIVVDVPSAPSVTKFYYSNGFMTESDDTTITNNSYSSGSSLVSVVIGDNVTSIGDSAFSGWSSSLASVTVGNSVTNIGDSAFWGCGNLTSVTIPNSVTSIGDNAFESTDEIILESNTPIQLNIGSYAIVIKAFGSVESGSGSGGGGRDLKIHVPMEAFDEYYNSTDPGWVYYRDCLVGYN